MKNKKFNKGIEEIKNISMTSLEKENVFKSVMNSPLKQKPVRSPWDFYSFTYFTKHRTVSYVAVFALVLILGGTGVGYASNSSLPGSALYPVKTNVIEPLHSALTFSLEGKAKYESALATERMVEAIALADLDKLDSLKEEKLNTLLVKHTNALNQNLEKIRENKKKEQREDDDKDEDIVTNFQAEMNARARVLDVVISKKNTEQEDEEGTEESISKISKTARENAGSIKNNLKDKDKETKRKERYMKRKSNIESIIESTKNDLDKDDSGEGKDESPRRKRIIDDTQKTLDQARQFLQEADEEDSKGDSDNAYFKLIDSESSAKEADILLRSRLRFRDSDD